MTSSRTARVTRMNNVHIYVRDMGRSLGFYRDVLGIALSGDEHWMEADLGGVRFALHPAPDGMQELSSGTVSVNFEVEDADAAAERIRAAGVEASEQMREEYGTSFEVPDPDGYRITLFQPPRP